MKLVKHLRPFAWVIMGIFVLLFAQAMAELSLPGLMSDIVNVGIQQNGVENAVPQAIRASEFNRVTLFMAGPEKAQVTSAYTLLDRQTLSSTDFDSYVKMYPVLASEPVYHLNTADTTRLEQLNAILGRYIPVVATIEKGGAAAFTGTPFQVPPGGDPFAVLSRLPPEQLDAVRRTIGSRIDAVTPTMLKQYATAYVASEYGAIGMDVGGIQRAYMLRIGMYMLLLTLGSAIASIIVGLFSSRTAAGLGRDLRRKLFVRVEDFSSTEFDKFSTASLITRSTNDITQIQMLMVMLFRVAFFAPILGIGGILKVIGADSAMLWIIAAAVGFMLTMMVVMFTVAVPRFRLVQKLMDRLNLVSREILTGLMVVRAFNTQGHEEQRYDAANTDLTKISLFVTRIMVFMFPAMMLLLNGVMLLIVWVGAHQVDAGALQVGDMMAFMQYAMLIIFSFLMVSFMFIMLPRASVSANRIIEVLDTEPAIKDPPRPKPLAAGSGTVEFQDVSFRYPGAADDVLQHITFIARPGQTTAFVGSTGSGKSTLINLIPRFYDATGGGVLVDGVDVREAAQHDLRSRIGYVSQKAVLFSGTIESNIRYANEHATGPEILDFVETAQARDFVMGGEKGLAAPVSQGGANLSGGQKQRLAIARALARKPQILIFDDSLSALDYRTDAALRQALKKETSNATILIVTQRVSTIRGADQIVVLDNGRVAGIGKHKDLIESCNVYREIALSQLSQKELVS